MAGLVVETEVNKLNGDRVYGCAIPEYSIEGKGTSDFMEAVAMGALFQSFAVEANASAVAALVKVRQTKVMEIGDALASLSEAVASMSSGSDTGRKSKVDSWKLPEANRIFRKYGIEEMNLDADGQVKYEDAYPKQTDVQLVLDRENNDLRQNMNSLQNMVAKRDNAFAVASKVVDKVVSTAKDTIHAIGA